MGCDVWLKGTPIPVCLSVPVPVPSVPSAHSLPLSLSRLSLIHFTLTLVDWTGLDWTAPRCAAAVCVCCAGDPTPGRDAKYGTVQQKCAPCAEKARLDSAWIQFNSSQLSSDRPAQNRPDLTVVKVRVNHPSRAWTRTDKDRGASHVPCLTMRADATLPSIASRSRSRSRSWRRPSSERTSTRASGRLAAVAG